MNNGLFEELWKRYVNEKIDKNEGEYLIEDGLDPDNANLYFEQKIKVMFVLKESNEENVPREERKRKSIYKENGWFANFGSDRAMITKMIKMYGFIQNFSPKNPGTVKEQSVKAESRYNFAFMNLNKHGNGKVSCDTNLKSIIEKDAALLIKQIELLKPDIIVFGVKKHFKDFEEHVLNPMRFNTNKVICTCHFSRISYKDFETQATEALKSP